MKGLKDYSKTVIYKIRCNDESVLDFYVGHTSNFRIRKNGHKSRVESDKSKVYEMIRANGGWENWTMIEVEVYPCNSSTEARIREEYWRETLQAKLNVKRAYCSEENYKKYYEEHKEEKLAYQKQYQQENVEQFSTYQKHYRVENADKIKAQRSQLINCGCGAIFQLTEKSRHERTTTHQEWLKTGKVKNNTNKCGCGGSYQNDNKCAHTRTKKHQDWLKTLF